jgi:hypothetical protein
MLRDTKVHNVLRNLGGSRNFGKFHEPKRGIGVIAVLINKAESKAHRSIVFAPITS